MQNRENAELTESETVEENSKHEMEKTTLCCFVMEQQTEQPHKRVTSSLPPSATDLTVSNRKYVDDQLCERAMGKGWEQTTTRFLAEIPQACWYVIKD